MKIRFADLDLDLPDGWFDTTDDLPLGSPPTLAKSDGMGALQFSRLNYAGGKRPDLNLNYLGSLIEEIFKNNGLKGSAWKPVGAATVFCICKRHTPLDVSVPGEHIIIWLLSNGDDVVQVSYTALECVSGSIEVEVAEAEATVQSIRL